MKAYQAAMNNNLMLTQANALQIPLPDQSVHCVAFSPPYFGLRDYGVDGQLGLEPTPDAYIAAMMDVMAEVWRVLRDDGTCWVNLGDSYGHGTRAKRNPSQTSTKVSAAQHQAQGGRHGGQAKQLQMIPFRFALAVQAAGWIVRQDIIWSKTNPMPESVKDRPTTAHEHVFLLAKSQRYYYDADAVRVTYTNIAKESTGKSITGFRTGTHGAPGKDRSEFYKNTGRNKRSVWTIATQSFPGAHFATWPEKLVEPMIKAGTSEKGVCPECGKQWVRLIDVSYRNDTTTDGRPAEGNHSDLAHDAGQRGYAVRTRRISETVGWQPTCEHEHKPVPAIVLDPFVGSGTTAAVARKLGRRAIGLDLSLPYLKLAQDRTGERAMKEFYNGKPVGESDYVGTLFEGIETTND